MVIKHPHQADIQAQQFPVDPLANHASSPELVERVLADPELASSDLRSLKLGSSELVKFELPNVELPNVELADPGLMNSQVANPEVANPQVENPQVENPEMASFEPVNQILANHVLANPVSTKHRNWGQSFPIQPLKLPALETATFSPSEDLAMHSEALENLTGAVNSSLNRLLQEKEGCGVDHSSTPVEASTNDRLNEVGNDIGNTLENRLKHKIENASWNQPANEMTNQLADYPSESPQERKRWRWTMVLLTAFGLFGGVGTSAFLWLTNLPPLPDCQYINAASPNSQQFFCAQEKVKSGKVKDLIAAVQQLQNWRPEQAYYQESRKAIEDWSAQLYGIAQQKYDQGDVTGAIEAVKHIPKTTKVYAPSQKAIQQWQEQWQQGKGIYDKALEAINAKKWSEASRQIVAFSDLVQVSWAIQNADVLRRRLEAEIQGNDILVQAKNLATAGVPEQLQQAIALVSRIVPATNVGKEAALLNQQWTEAILTISMQRWERGEITESFTAARHLPLGLDLPGHGEDLVRLSYAYELSDAAVSTWEPTLEQVWKLREAIAVIQPIQPGSPFFPQALESRQSWQFQLEDLAQLKFATLTASLGFRPTLELAIAQAQQVAPNRPRRLQAQTLASYWIEERQRMVDRPYLAKAQALAEPADMPHLKLAIQQAQQIPQQRLLWSEAQVAIAHWQKQIQTIEDRPVIKQAEVLAKAKQFDEAIKIATKVVAGRALYPQAQAAIANWQAEIRRIQVAADRPILDKAYALAAKGSLTRAIEVAAQIAPGRALSGEAWNAIALWDKQLHPPEPASIGVAQPSSPEPPVSSEQHLDQESDLESNDTAEAYGDGYHGSEQDIGDYSEPIPEPIDGLTDESAEELPQ